MEMENHSYSNSSYSDSRNSTPRSREIDFVNQQSWNEPKVVKLMCSYGGKIQPRPHDNKLSYVGGDTKILTVDRSIKFGDFIAKLSRLCGSKVGFKYQLPGEDLDALISVTNDEGLEHMMLEYARSAKPARLRLFLFAPTLEGTGANSDLDEGGQAAGSQNVVKGGEQVVLEGQVLSQVEIQRRIDELQRMQISCQEHVVYQHVSDGTEGFMVNGGGGDYYTTQKVTDSAVPAQQGMPAYWQDQSQVTAGGAGSGAVQQQRLYVIPSFGGVYQASTNYRPMTSHVGQAHMQGQESYGIPRVVPDAYQEQQIHSSIPGPVAQNFQQPTIGLYAEGGYAVTYDGNGRQVYYAVTAAGGGAAPTYQVVPAAAALNQFAAVNQEGK